MLTFLHSKTHLEVRRSLNTLDVKHNYEFIGKAKYTLDYRGDVRQSANHQSMIDETIQGQKILKPLHIR